MSTQRTPQGETISVPTRGEVFRDLAKVAKGGKHLPGSRPKPPPRHGMDSVGREGGEREG